MEILNNIIDNLYTMPLTEAVLWIFIENFLVFALSLTVGGLVARFFQARPVVYFRKTTPFEFILAVSAVFCNSLVTFAGLLLWKKGYIHLRKGFDWRGFLDFVVLFVAMDCFMYFLHRAAHLPVLFSLIHKTHHRFEQPTPLTLFALNPIEDLGFGLLWLVVLITYPASWLGVSVYLTLNVFFGLVGHLGVEPLPDWWVRVIILRNFTTSTFHAQHHQEGRYNFGFYTLIWDRIFGTLSPHYLARFGQLPVLVKRQ